MLSGPNCRQESRNYFVLLEWVEPGTRIITDMWASYRLLDNHPKFTHASVNHTYNFVLPTDDEVHTQNVENMWHHAKHKLKRQYGTTQDLLESYLYEHMWRKHCSNKKTIFGYFLYTLRVCYNE